MKWKRVDSPAASAEEIMQKDHDLLVSLEKEELPILHFYEWKGPSATYGYFTDPFDFLNKEQVELLGLDLARRPTGGGIIFHIWDFAFSVLVPSHLSLYSQNTLENYAFVNLAVKNAAQEFLQTDKDLELIQEHGDSLGKSCEHFCMAKPTKYDVMLEGRKVAGAAQRKTKHGFLHQGSVSMLMPSKEYLEKVLLPGSKVVDAMFAWTCPLLGKNSSLQDLDKGRKKMKELLETHITRES